VKNQKRDSSVKITDPNYVPKPGDIFVLPSNFRDDFTRKLEFTRTVPYDGWENTEYGLPNGVYFYFNDVPAKGATYVIKDVYVANHILFLGAYWEEATPDVSHLPEGQIDPVGRWA